MSATPTKTSAAAAQGEVERLQPELAWLDGAFRRDATIDVRDGRIVGVGTGVDAHATTHDGRRVELPRRALLPGFVNAHSHAFQRGLRGRTERFPAGVDSFWGWREQAYRLVESLDAETCHAWSLRAFREMRSAGITAVGEFHYVRHPATGPRFALDRAVIAAARDAGIRLTLLVAAYRTRRVSLAARPAPLESAQERFATGPVDEYLRRLDELADLADGEDVRLGIVAHSVRAVPIDDIARLHDEAQARGMPFHLHLEEAPREIEECREVYARTPMRLLLDHACVSARTVAVHCTHSTPEDLDDFAAAGGSICLCPVTEANLGDGIANVARMRSNGTPLSFGTDLNSRIDPFEELRLLEYAQRLGNASRGVVRDADGDAARALMEIGTVGGAHALGLDTGELAVGRAADFCLVDLDHPNIDDADERSLAGALLFGAGAEVVHASCVAGRWSRGDLAGERAMPEADAR